MPYTIQALIGEEADAFNAAPSGSSVISLPQSKGLVPLTKTVRHAHQIPFLPLTDEGALELPCILHEIAAPAIRMAYIEAEIFGGDGMQAAAVWEKGTLVFGPVVAIDAINQALRILGVTKNGRFDDFDAIDLGRYRDTEMWK